VCILAIYNRVSERWPLVVAANRDEFLERPSLGPARLERHPAITAGLDLRAGGTWLGAREDGYPLAAALLNRRQAGADSPAPPGKYSRGALCLGALDCGNSGLLSTYLDGVEGGDYGPFFLLTADSSGANVLDDGGHSQELAAGVTVITNLGVDPPDCVRHAGALPRFRALLPLLESRPELEDIVEALAAVLSDHELPADAQDQGALAGVCVHAGDYGTRSASILARDERGRLYYFHADGPPCRTGFDRINPRPIPASTS